MADRIVGALSRRHWLSAAGAATLPFARMRPAFGQSTRLRIGTTSNEGSGPVFYAVDQGFFERAGVNVDVIMLQNGSAVGAALAGGSLDIGTSSTFVFINAYRRGLPYVIVAPAALYRSEDPLSALAVAPNSPIVRASDLNGKIVAGISIGALDQLAGLAWIDQNGGDSKTVKFVESSSSSMVDGLESGRFAAAIIVDPQLTAAGSRIRVLGRAYDAIAKTFMVGAWFADSAWAAKNTLSVRRFNDAMGQAQRWALANPERAAESLEKWTKVQIPRARMRYAARLDPSLVQPICDAALKYKMIDAPLDARSFFWSDSK